MATSKKSRREKISEYLVAFSTVSASTSNIEKMLKLTENPELKKYIQDQEAARVKFNQEKIDYLKKQIFYQAAKIADEMDAEKFARFAKLVSENI